MNKLLKVADVTERLSLSRTTVFQLISDGKLTPIRIGRCLRFRESDIAEFIEAHADTTVGGIGAMR